MRTRSLRSRMQVHRRFRSLQSIPPERKFADISRQDQPNLGNGQVLIPLTNLAQGDGFNERIALTATFVSFQFRIKALFPIENDAVIANQCRWMVVEDLQPDGNVIQIQDILNTITTPVISSRQLVFNRRFKVHREGRWQLTSLFPTKIIGRFIPLRLTSRYNGTGAAVNVTTTGTLWFILISDAP